MTNSLPWKIHPFLIGKPSINGPSIPWLFNITRGYAFIHSFEIDLWIREFIDHWFLTKRWSTAWLAHFEARKKGSPILKWLALSKIFWLVVWNIFIFPYIRNNHPNWLIFSKGLKPPTSIWFFPKDADPIRLSYYGNSAIPALQADQESMLDSARPQGKCTTPGSGRWVHGWPWWGETCLARVIKT